VTTTGAPGPGIAVFGSAVRNVVVQGNTVKSTAGTGSGILLKDGVKDVSVKGNKLHNLANGIVLQSCSVVTLEDNHVSASGGDGIRIESGSSASRITLRGNVSYNNGRSKPFSAGISILAGDRVRLLENQCFDDQATLTQAYAILVANTVTGVVILDNDVSVGGLQIAAWNHPNAPVLVRDNRGYVTRAKNSVTLAAGTSSRSVPHGMSRDFDSVNNVRLTPRSNLGGLGYWVDDPTPGDGAFRINLSGNAPPGGVTFAYEVWSDRTAAY
jgi:parallel beta-helix repeat protein